MADNIDITPGAGATVATDDIGGVEFQRIKLIYGADGVNSGDVSSANPFPVTIPPNTAAGSITTQNLVPAGTATAGSAVELTVDDSSSSAVQVTGTYTGALSVQATVDGSVWVTLSGVPLVNINTGASSATIPSAATSIYQMDCSAFLKVRVTALAAVTGTAVVTMIGSAGTGAVAIDTALPTGTNDIGGVTVRQPQFWFEIDVPGVAATSHTAGDQLGTLISITNAARVTGGGGFINSIIYHDNDDALGAIDVVFFNDTLTLAADDAAFAISDADARKTLYLANITYLTDLGAQRYGQLSGISVPYFCTGTTLFVALIVRVTGTTSAAGQRIRFGLTRD